MLDSSYSILSVWKPQLYSSKHTCCHCDLILQSLSQLATFLQKAFVLSTWAAADFNQAWRCQFWSRGLFSRSKHFGDSGTENLPFNKTKPLAEPGSGSCQPSAGTSFPPIWGWCVECSYQDLSEYMHTFEPKHSQFYQEYRARIMLEACWCLQKILNKFKHIQPILVF